MLICIVLWLLIISNQAFASTCARGDSSWGIKNSIKYILQADSILYGQAKVIQTPPRPTEWWARANFSWSQKTKFVWEIVYKGTQEIELVSSFWSEFGQWGGGYYLENWIYYLVFSQKNSQWFYTPLFGTCSNDNISAVSVTLDMTLQMMLFIYVYRFYFLTWLWILIVTVLIYVIYRTMRSNKKEETIDPPLENQNT